MGSGIVTVMEKCRTGVEDRPHMVYHLSMCLHHVKIESIWVLALEVSKETFTKSCRLYHTAYALASEEGVKFSDGSVQGLRGSSALEFKVHLLRPRATAVVGGGGHEGSELLGMEGCVLD